MKGRKFNRNPTAGSDETDEKLRRTTRSNTEVSNKLDIPKAKPLAVIHGKRAGARLDKPVRGKADAYAYKNGGKLTAKARKALPTKSFAMQGERKYPIEDASHARNALARVSQHGTSEQKAKVRAAVHRRYPGIGKK